MKPDPPGMTEDSIVFRCECISGIHSVSESLTHSVTHSLSHSPASLSLLSQDSSLVPGWRLRRSHRRWMAMPTTYFLMHISMGLEDPYSFLC